VFIGVSALRVIIDNIQDVDDAHPLVSIRSGLYFTGLSILIGVDLLQYVSQP
jgi:hypothetical protein